MAIDTVISTFIPEGYILYNVVNVNDSYVIWNDCIRILSLI
jgi:hypothetical protein